MGDDAGDFIGVVGDPDIHDSIVESVTEDGDSVRVTLRRSWHQDREARPSTPRMEIHFVQVKDVSARGEVGMTLYSLAEMKCEPPWRRFVFTNWDDDDPASLEVVARDVRWSDVPRHHCPCCGFATLDGRPPGTDEICAVCSWQDDVVQSSDPAFVGGPNDESLDECRASFLEDLSSDPAKKAALTSEWGPPGA